MTLIRLRLIGQTQSLIPKNPIRHEFGIRS